jgi:AsmA family protein
VTGLADGTIIGFASLDGTQDPVDSEFDLRLKALQLQDMLAKLEVSGEGLGEFNGRIRLEGRGTSVDQVLGSASGQTVLTMTGGGLDALIVEAIGLDVAESIAVLLDSLAQSEEDKVPIRCAIVNLQIEQGVATARPVVIDTTDSKIIVDGKVNLKDEMLDVFIQSFPKDASPLSFNQPIHVDGRILSPSVNPAPGKTANEVLGWLLAPVAALLPFFDVGGEEDSPCGSLLAQAKEAAEEPPPEPAD